MSDQELPVTVVVTRSDGSVEHVRVGTATRRGEGFSLRIAELTIGAAGAAREESRRGAAMASDMGGGPTVLPPYGRSKGAPIRGASLQDLEYYSKGARRTLDDPGKARWHEKERALLAAIEAEIALQRGEGSGEGAPPPGDDDAPF